MEISAAEWTVAGRRVSAAAGSVVGSRYRENYDVLHLDPDRPLAVVADGMGDGPGSRAAGRTAVGTFVRGSALTPYPGGLRSAIAEVQRDVRAAGRGLPGLTGCTLTAFVADPADGSAWLAQLGDSRAYRLRDGLLELLTVDHTVAWLGLLNGWYPADSRQAHADRYRLTRYAGHPGEPEADLLNVSLRPGDVLLLCTDGIADQVAFHRIGEVLTAAPAAAAESLLADTLPVGADNATAVVMRVS
ncbi:protein phosphatase 2C domain-containing protein [Actinoplanes sp. NPDC024001]|uniref:PP2C family protein-serine/threonine phosphatase n=1 Tax=Actinoplanes sp. NPDC024001 TaxID=3154598 RepID=UPI0033E647CF